MSTETYLNSSWNFKEDKLCINDNGSIECINSTCEQNKVIVDFGSNGIDTLNIISLTDRSLKLQNTYETGTTSLYVTKTMYFTK